MGEPERITRLESDVGNLRVDVATLKQDAISSQVLSDKLDKNLDKLQEVVVTMTTMIKLHEAELKHHIQSDKDIQSGLERKLDEQSTAIASLRERFNELEKTVISEISKLKSTPKKPEKSLFFFKMTYWHWVLIGIVIGGLLAAKLGHDFFLNLLSNILPVIF